MLAAVALAVAPTPAAIAAPADDTSVVNDVAAAVNTFIGTKDEGNTFPGASAPFGMTQVSPIGSHYAGWRYDDPTIKGFGHFFLSGAGCWEQGGQISVLPTTGTVARGGDFDTARPGTFDHNNYAARYTHDGELGQAGYYRTRLTSYGGIDVETTAATRTGAERYTFGESPAANIFVNVGQANDKHRVTASSITVVDEHTLEGAVETKSFCGGTRYTTWFTMRFDRPFAAFGTWDPSGGEPGRRSTSGGAGLRGAWVSFDTTGENPRSVTALTAISHVDAEGARRNLAAEGMRHDELLSFYEIRERTQNAWRSELERVQVGGGTRDDEVVFYTALYHVLLQPLTGNDVDGRYRGFDDQLHRVDDWTYYEFFSLWDTYRTHNQLLAMLQPARARDIARSVLTIHEQGGWLPRWAYANFETNVMTGDPVTPFLVDLWRFGALDGREEQAYSALRRNATEVPPEQSPFSGRSGNPTYLEKGFVHYDPNFRKKGMDVDPAHGGSATLEYALADCALSVMAGGLGEHDDARIFRERGNNWRNLWDDTVADRGFTGFPRPRNADGSWYTPPTGKYSPSSDKGFHEGTAWQYQWLVQQNVPGLVEAMGGVDETARRLDAFFAYDKLVADHVAAPRKEWVVGPYDYYNQYRYNPNNEPDLHAPWMYALIGQPWKTSTVVRAAQTLFTNGAGGVTGNDDLGTMSAWYVFSALGMYPAVPGTGQFVLHAPRFEKVVVELANGGRLVIEAPGADGRRLQYVSGLKLGKADRDKVWVSWAQLRSGQTLSVTLSDSPPEDGWGTAPGAAPASPCAAGEQAAISEE
ncbi:GH92 family glycosyl hydrolase [Longimycelium tulufanense]|uniref:GH92 family glycosyl hydrolase n=1 Tax=Longimycelium tulufanense TaxID=907463 RepID=UPI00166C8165